MQRVTILICICCFGCDEEFVPPDITWEGENVLFGTTYDELPCGDTLEILDEEISRLDSNFGFPMRDKKITYYWISNEELKLACQGMEYGGCTNGKRTVYSTTPFHQHELTHAVLYNFGRSHQALEEGFAVTYQWNQNTPEYPCDIGDIPCGEAKELLISYFSDPPSNALDMNYQYLAHFTRYLINSHGVSKVLRVYDRASLDSGYEEIQEIFSDELGSSLDENLDEWLDFAPSCYSSMMGCDNPEIQQIDETHWTQYVHFNCESEDGLIDTTNALYLYRSFQVPEDGEYTFSVDVSSDEQLWSVQLYGCSDCTFRETFSSGSEKDFYLSAGTYQLLLLSMWYPFEIDEWLDLSITKK